MIAVAGAAPPLALSDKFMPLCVQAKVPDDFQEWRVAEEILEVQACVLLACSEATVGDRIVAVARDSGAVQVGPLKVQVAISKLWKFCRNVEDRDANVKSGRIQDTPEALLDSSVTQDLQDS